MKAKRIQLSRKKGWRKPANTVIVSRPSKWGNPFRVGDIYTRGRLTPDDAVKLFEHAILARCIGPDLTPENIKLHLRGKNLACWCKIKDGHGNYAPCHGTILLVIANT